MSGLVSIGAKVKQVEGLLGTKDLTAWEDKFVRNVVARSDSGRDTTMLSSAQVERLEEMWEKHFA